MNKTVEQKLWLRSGILEEYWPLDFDDYVLNEKDAGYESKKNALNWAKKYASILPQARQKGISLFFHGVNGGGKTMLGVSILKEAIRQNFTAQFASLGGIVQTLTEGWYDDDQRRKYEMRIKNVDFLMIDDVGKEFKSKSGLSEVAFDNLIRYRSFRNKPMILTTNTDIKDIASTYGNSVVSLLTGKFIPLKVVGEDFRKTHLSTTVIDRLLEG